MWILSSLSRPDRLREVAFSYRWGDESQVVLALYSGDEKLHDYLRQEWPPQWIIQTVPMRGNGPTYNEILKRYPNEPTYGFLADDSILDVPGMLKKLEDAAGDWNVAYPNDQFHGEKLPTMPCIGGKLVRAVGYLAPPNIIHWAIDNCWGDIGRALGCLRYFNHLTYTHKHPILGTAPDDETYRQARLNSTGWDQAYRSFRLNEMPRLIERVNAARGEVST